MKVLFVTDYFPPVAPGGAEWSNYYQLSNLAQRGVSLGLATIGHGPTPLPIDGVSVFSMPIPFKLPPGQRIHRQGVLENILFHAGYARFVRRTARVFRPDVIHAQSKNSLPAAAWAAQRLHIPLVFTLRDIGLACPFGMCFVNGRERCDDFSLFKLLGSCSSFLIDRYTPGGILQTLKVKLLALVLWPDTKLKQFCLKRVDWLISPSRGLLEAYPPSLLPSPERREIIPHFPPPPHKEAPASSGLAFLSPLKGKRFVLYAGKLSLGKGTYTLIEAIKNIAPKHPDVSYVFIGKGTLKDRNAPHTYFFDSIPHSDLLDVMRQAEIVVVPSIVPEAYNRVALEAMDAGKPVIAARSGSLPEQVKDKITGLLFSPGRTDELARALDALLSSPSQAHDMGKAGKDHISTIHSNEKILTLLTSLYSKATAPYSELRPSQ
ncbi:MAG TPA: glycosyltransferase family 4 protein [Elusimicrobiota bacterium]|nr:glycosyltransferase family 4 protein [Elusimicrobiota bacterium]